MSALAIIVTHQNAPCGPVLTEEALAAAMRTGTVTLPGISVGAQALISFIFQENRPELILRAAREVGAEPAKLAQLYREYLADCPLPIPAWEAAMAELGLET